MRSDDLTIVIPQRDSVHLTIESVQSLLRAHATRYPILIVDDGSRASDLEQIQRLQEEGTELLMQPPRGVTAAWQAGLEQVRTRYVLFLNNDTVTHSSWIPRLLEPLESKDAMMTGAALRIEPHLPESVPARLSRCSILEGWCFASEVETVWQLGGFDLSFKLYFSDTDLQLRLLLQYSSHASPLVSAAPLAVRHLGHATTSHCPMRRQLWQQDRHAFLRKWRCRSGQKV